MRGLQRLRRPIRRKELPDAGEILLPHLTGRQSCLVKIRRTDNVRAGLSQEAWRNRENRDQKASSQTACGLPQIETHVLQPPMDLGPEYGNYTRRWMRECSSGL